MSSQKHPPALYLLAATNAGERFAYYGMRALLILYMVAGVTGAMPGMNFSEGVASNIYGVSTAYAICSRFLEVSLPTELLAKEDRLL